MDIKAIKLTFIEEFLRIDDERIIMKLTEVLRHEKEKNTFRSLESLAGTLNEEDAKTFLEASQDSRKTDIDGW